MVEIFNSLEMRRFEQRQFVKKSSYSYMQNASFLILTSLWEEVGFVIVEAAMLKCLL